MPEIWFFTENSNGTRAKVLVPLCCLSFGRDCNGLRLHCRPPEKNTITITIKWRNYPSERLTCAFRHCVSTPNCHGPHFTGFEFLSNRKESSSISSDKRFFTRENYKPLSCVKLKMAPFHRKTATLEITTFKNYCSFRRQPPRRRSSITMYIRCKKGNIVNTWSKNRVLSENVACTLQLWKIYYCSLPKLTPRWASTSSTDPGSDVKINVHVRQRS